MTRVPKASGRCLTRSWSQGTEKGWQQSGAFRQDGADREERSPCCLWPKSKQRPWEQRRQCWEASTTNHKKISVTHLPGQDPEAPEVVQIPSQEHFQEKQGWSLCYHYASPDHWVAMKRQKTKQELMCAQCRSNRLWRNPMTLMSKSVLLMERGRCVCSWLLILTLWMLPAKPEPFQLSPPANSKYCFHHTIHFWLNIY